MARFIKGTTIEFPCNQCGKMRVVNPGTIDRWLRFHKKTRRLKIIKMFLVNFAEYIIVVALLGI